ncbi:B3/B4 domain-containing protein [Jeotgalibacillus proteolyticus]|uniref:B3/B4 tRNA-binding domain-containing protein n=1 Tax=Jeotgalibacillus proteolyticus TaxID=2082395 RepID=A0A2S5GHS9_9BACL|nr:phenylalanine--tRNA ligase beta subunit-related protein [Jeotgalibacillus proteolyticus]PPA72465.1 hypothetical protein C4B60_03570 [Jeotgalibacillus proteolyticus]
MNVSLHSELLKSKQPLSFGIIQYKDIEVGESPQMLKGRLQLFQESIFFELQDKGVTEFEGIKEWRSIFKNLGKDPNRYRHSAEALYRRIKKQNYLTPIHSAIDLNNFFSLQYQCPIGLYDSFKIDGDIIIRLGSTGEEFEGLNNRLNSAENLLLTADSVGPFGSPFVDSKRTAVSESTSEAIQIIYLTPDQPVENQKKLTRSLMDMFLQIHGGSGEMTILSNQNE